MNYKKLLFVSILFGVFSCQNETTPESITKDFIDKMAQANCNEAKKLTSGEATSYVESIVETGCSPFESNLKFVKCETSEETAKCECEEERDGISINFNYYFKKQNDVWLINSIEGGAKPEDIIEGFMQFLADGDCKSAKKLTLGSAITFVDKIESQGCNSYASTIESIECVASNSSANCNVYEIRDNRKLSFEFELIPSTGLGWRITSIRGGVNPEAVVFNFVTALSDGNCELAKELATGNAMESINATIDAGCESYKTEIVSVKCKIKGESSECSCNEVREGLDMIYDYELEHINGEWKISNFKKQMDDLESF